MNTTVKKPSPVGVIIGFAVTFLLFITSLDEIEDLWFLYVLFLCGDIATLIGYITQKKMYDKWQNASAVLYESQKLPAPAMITVVREPAAIAANFPFSVCVNGTVIGAVANGGSFAFTSDVNINLLNFIDGAGNLFQGEVRLELAPGDAAEVHIKGGKVLNEVTKVTPGGYAVPVQQPV